MMGVAMTLTSGSTVKTVLAKGTVVLMTVDQVADSVSIRVDLWDGGVHAVRLWEGDAVEVASGSRRLFVLRVCEIDNGVCFAETESLLDASRIRRRMLPRLRRASVRRVPDPRRVIPVWSGR